MTLREGGTASTNLFVLLVNDVISSPRREDSSRTNDTTANTLRYLHKIDTKYIRCIS